MANIAFPGGDSFFNPGVYSNPALQGEASAELRRAKSSPVRKGGKSGEIKKKGFASLFEKALPGELRELPLSEDSVHELLDNVHNAGDMLAKRPFPPEIMTYKEAVRNFIHYVVEHGFNTEEQISGAGLLKRKKYTLIQIIDKKLEEMAAAILRGQTEQMEILAKTGEIKGLLIDLIQ